MLALPKIATSTNYAAGADAWSATPTKVAPDADYESHGWTPDKPVAATHENYTKAAIIACVEELQEITSIRPVKESVIASCSSLFQWLPDTGVFVTVDGTNPNATPTAFDRDAARSKAGATDVNLHDVSILTAYGAGVTRTAYFLSAVLASQGKLATIADNAARTLAFDATIPVSGAGWLGMIATPVPASPTTYIPILVDAAGITFCAAGTWISHTFTAGTWHSIAEQSTAVGVWCFAANRTAWSTNLGGGSTWTEAAATWDAAAGAPPSSASMFRPTWDATLGRWMVGTADISTANLAASTAKLWTSTDGYTWVTFAATPGFVFVRVVRHVGRLWALGICADPAAAPHAHGGLEVFVSNDDSVTWVRTGVVVSFATSTTAADYRMRVEIIPAGNRIVFQASLGLVLEYAILPCDV
jgi:hypothetical protein